jgi:hypothetical protein
MLTGALAFAALFLPVSAAGAQQAAIARHVTIREHADRHSGVVTYATPGEAISLLDGG